jgi:hypothetical protein
MTRTPASDMTGPAELDSQRPATAGPDARCDYRDRRRRFRDLLAAGVTVAALLACPRAFGWNFDEHTELGGKGYQAACDQIAHDNGLDVQPKSDAPGAARGAAPPDPCITAKDDKTVRWCLACRTFSPALYGQSVAIAGDHVGSPEELMSPAGQVVAASAVDYTFLALVNDQHFHPAAPRNWRTFHEKALELATQDYPNGPIARDFAQVFYTSAFADHFLEDAFSAGHAGFNRPSTGAVASKAFHDVWNESGRLVRSPTGRCWLQYGDNKLKYASDISRGQIDAAEKASVFDVLSAFITRARDAGREVAPIYYLPSETTPDPLPGRVWAYQVDIATEKKDKQVVGGKKATTRVTSNRVATSQQPVPEVKNPKVINDLYDVQRAQLTDGHCPAVEMVPIDGISNPALIDGGVDLWGGWTGDSQLNYGSLDVLYNHRLTSFMSLPFFWEAGAGVGYLRREGQGGWAPSLLLGGLGPPLYLVHGLWRNEIGAQVRGYLATHSSKEGNGYGTLFLRSSIEAATTIIRLQVGPTVDFRSGRFGVVAALGVEFAGARWITGGGSLTDF